MIEQIPSCEECGAPLHGPLRPFGSHYPFCGYFSARAYLEDQKADAEAWAIEAAMDNIPPSDFEEPDALPY